MVHLQQRWLLAIMLRVAHPLQKFALLQTSRRLITVGNFISLCHGKNLKTSRVGDYWLGPRAVHKFMEPPSVGDDLYDTERLGRYRSKEITKNIFFIYLNDEL